MIVRLPIQIYVVMADVVRQGGFKKQDWAKAAGMPLARITDLNRLARMTPTTETMTDQDKLQKAVGRAFTLEKAFNLIQGVKTLMGDTGIERLLDRLPELNNKDQQNMLMLICLPEKQKVSANIFLETLLKASYPNIKLSK
jgi:hypothetical protein